MSFLAQAESLATEKTNQYSLRQLFKRVIPGPRLALSLDIDGYKSRDYECWLVATVRLGAGSGKAAILHHSIFLDVRPCERGEVIMDICGRGENK